MSAWSWVALLAVLAGCGERKVEYHKVEFPGFVLEVPTAVEYAGNRIREYTAGSTKAISERNGRAVFVTWQPGVLSTPDEMASYVKAIASLMPKPTSAVTTGTATPETVGGQKALRIDATIETMRMLLVEVECGKRSVQLAALAYRGVDAIMAKMVSTFACTPIATAEARVGGVPIGVDDPALLAGYYHTEDPEMYSLTNDAVSLMFTSAPGGDREDADALHKMIPAMFGAHGVWKNRRRETRGARTYQHGDVTVDGTTLAALIVLWNCDDDRTDAVMALAMAPERTDIDAVVEVLGKIRCAKPGDAPLKLRPTPKDDDAAVPAPTP
ncbi:MAG: hypothetical protein H0T79_05320 [Deltaproteobacteria bacterium]|nr:hypothetical protein [Deltaproteobacteria bacterium]